MMLLTAVLNTDLSSEDESQSYKTELMAVAVLLAVILACCIIVGLVLLLYWRAGYSLYRSDYSFSHSFIYSLVDNW